MKLTTKMIKDLIREEIESNKETMTPREVAEKLGAPVGKKQVTNEGFDNITLENIMLVLQALAKMGIELSPAALGGSLVAAAMKIKDLMKDKEVADNPELYDDED